MSDDIKIIKELENIFGFELKQKQKLDFNKDRFSYALDGNGNVFELSLNYLNISIKQYVKYIAAFKSIIGLSMNGQQFTSFPKEISELKNLTSLYLSGTAISSFPKEISELNRLYGLWIDSEKFTVPPPEIAQKGITAIFEYFKELGEEKEAVNEAKLIIVGQGDVGKTCLANKLIHNRFIEQVTTEGIDILNWEIKAPDNIDNIKLNVWDFGGQEIYHATHQFFLTLS
ncbi:MAG: ADP-ribosylation factor-like protein [Ignavibacteria bacterium]|jgi:hypothetical protein